MESPGPGRSPRRESRRRPGRGPAGTSFWGNLIREVRGRPAQDFVLLLEQLVAFTQLPKLRRLARRGTGPDPVIDVGDLQPALQTRLGDPEVLRDLRDRRVALTGDRDHVTSELGRERFRHDRHPPSEDPRPHRSGVNRTGGSPNVRGCRRRVAFGILQLLRTRSDGSPSTTSLVVDAVRDVQGRREGAPVAVCGAATRSYPQARHPVLSRPGRSGMILASARSLPRSTGHGYTTGGVRTSSRP